MKQLLTAFALSVFCLFLGSCSTDETGEFSPMLVSDTTQNETTVTSAESSTAAATTTTKITTSAKVTETVTETSQVPETNSENYNSKELEMLEKEGRPDYNVMEAAIPYVGWTEVNLDKIMYPLQKTIGYQYALSDAKPVMVYDAGIALEVIARTSTGYYRIRNDIYIPCDFLSEEISPDANAAAATSAPVVTTAAVSSSQ